MRGAASAERSIFRRERSSGPTSGILPNFLSAARDRCRGDRLIRCRLHVTRGVNMERSFSVAAAVLGALVVLPAPQPARADDDGDNLRAVPFVFVGKAGDCGTLATGEPYPAGSRIVTSAWLGGMGLPDNGGMNTTLVDFATNPNKQDPHLGLLLSKNGPTVDCSSAGAQIRGVRGMEVGPTFLLGFDYRNGGHC